MVVAGGAGASPQSITRDGTPPSQPTVWKQEITTEPTKTEQTRGHRDRGPLQPLPVQVALGEQSCPTRRRVPGGSVLARAAPPDGNSSSEVPRPLAPPASAPQSRSHPPTGTLRRQAAQGCRRPVSAGGAGLGPGGRQSRRRENSVHWNRPPSRGRSRHTRGPVGLTRVGHTTGPPCREEPPGTRCQKDRGTEGRHF